MGGRHDREHRGRPAGRRRLTRSADAAQVLPLVAARALDRAFDYAVPPELESSAVPGAMVVCPLGARRIAGVILSRAPATHAGALAPLAGMLAAPPLRPELLELARWVAGHYAAPTAACLGLVMPPGTASAVRRRSDGTWRLAASPGSGAGPLVARLAANAVAATGRRAAIIAVLSAAGGSLAAGELCQRAGCVMSTLHRMTADGQLALAPEGRARSGLDWFAAPAPAADTAPDLTAEQAAALARIVSGLDAGGALLLHGVTGSGKTEVYLRALAEARRRGRTGLVLVPEISLTPQILGRLRARLGERIGVWHSGLSPAERAAEYARARDGEVDIVLGARSAVFAPLPRLGLIVVDEEHDASYKQDATPRYDARQVAYRRGRREGALVIYGSATPRPESWHVLPRISLSRRADGAPLPPVRRVDMRTQPPGPISRPLAQALRDAMARGEKAIVLVNRRGFALMALCRACGWIATCPDCEVPLVLHRDPERLGCHHCGHEMPVPRLCPACGAAEVVRQGSGAEGVEGGLRRLLPKARLMRLDAGTAAGRGSIAAILDRFAAPGPAILVGTQMVAKGHDLPAVTVAGVLAADAGLQIPDFRAEERAFGLIVQLAGRAGRRGEPSLVIVQAFEPNGRAVRLAAEHAVAEFLDGELERRRPRGFPPFGHLVRTLLSGGDEESVEAAAGDVAGRLRAAAPGLDVRGPARQHRLRGRARRTLMVRAERVADAREATVAALTAVRADLAAAGVRAVIDVDPQET